MEVQDIFEDLPDLGPVNTEVNAKVFKVCLGKLDAHFEPRTMYRKSDIFFVNLRQHQGRLLTNSWFVYVNKPVTATLAKL